jgi:hypothetical protein
MGAWGEKTTSENISHSQRKVVRQEGCLSSHFRTTPCSVCEFFPKAVCDPGTPPLVSQKRKKLQSKKVNTHHDIHARIMHPDHGNLALCESDRDGCCVMHMPHLVPHVYH